ncbi:JAB domain-containing protein [Novosphingobium resinovorum]|nr:MULTISPECIES: JAB domain-containing protein [Novosphingobium]MBF7010979.1 DNA repair protein RadC [Novosphingobium sp. HR1a]WJM28973.1 JAB domain-containing protein [Novosphingobium resinovorum]
MSHVAAHEAGQVSILAALLAPYAGDAGEDIAGRLIGHFGSLRTIYSASLESLRQAMGDDGPSSAWLADAIVAARRLAEAASREAMRGLPLDTGSAEFRRYLVNRLGCRREECVQVFYFNGEGIYIAEDLYTGGRRTECLIPLRRTVRRAFDLDARRIVLAHNHPSGAARPSADDIAATARFRQIVEPLEIRLDDHCIVAGNAVASMRTMGIF